MMNNCLLITFKGVLTVFFLLIHCIGTAAIHTKKTTTAIHFLFTSDMHGWLSSSLMYPNHRQTGLLHLKDQIQKLKQLHNGLIMIDAGDLLQGSPLAHYYHHVAIDNEVKNPFFYLFNNLEFDAVVVGNHDFSLNPYFEKGYVPKSHFTWLGANVYRNGKNVFKPYIIRNQNGIRIAILGFTTPGVQMWLGPDQLNGIKIEPVEKSVKSWINSVKATEKPDFILGVFHVGLNPFRDSENAKLNRLPPANSLRTILNNIHDFDLVVSGHDHRLHPTKSGQKPHYINSTPVISAGNSGEAALLVNIELKKIKKRWLTDTINIDVKRAKSGKYFKNQLVTYLDSGYFNYIAEPLPWLLSGASKKEVQFCLNYLLSLSSDAPSLDGTLFPGVSIFDLKSLKQRNIRRSDLFKWIKYDNKSVTVLLSKRDIHLITHPELGQGRHDASYNRTVIPWFKKNINYQTSEWLLSGEQFEPKYLFKISDYHFWGGGGLIPQSVRQTKQKVVISEFFQRDELFQLLKTSVSLPKICNCLKYTPLK